MDDPYSSKSMGGSGDYMDTCFALMENRVPPALAFGIATVWAGILDRPIPPIIIDTYKVITKHAKEEIGWSRVVGIEKITSLSDLPLDIEGNPVSDESRAYGNYAISKGDTYLIRASNPLKSLIVRMNSNEHKVLRSRRVFN